jgi:murein tripeptide amidase MpaA
MGEGDQGVRRDRGLTVPLLKSALSNVSSLILPPSISAAFDSGAIEVVSIQPSERSADFTLRIRKDSHADFTQWFHFRLSGARGVECTLRFANAGECTYPGGWKDYRAVASYDRERCSACRRRSTDA